MLRGVISFPGDVSPELVAMFREKMKAVETSKEAETLILAHGGTYTRYPIQKPPPAIVRRARALHR